MSAYYHTVDSPSPGPYEKHDQYPLTEIPANYKSPEVVGENFAVAEPHQAPMSPWQPGLFHSAPWLGLSAILATILCAVGALAALVLADGKETDKWPTESHRIQLSVIIAVLMGVANGALAFAHSEGVTLTWWVKVLKGVPLSDTHQVWQNGASAWHSILSIRHISKVSLASIFFVVLFLDGPLIQKAANFVSVAETTPTTLSVPVSTGLIDQPTAIYQTRAKAINALTGNFTQVVKGYTDRSDILLDVAGCNGTCHGTIIAAGFDIQCQSTKDSIPEFAVDYKAGATVSIGSISVISNGTFDSSAIYVNTKFKPFADNTLIRTNCTLHAAKVGYPVTFINGTVTLDQTDIRNANHTVALGYVPRESAGVGMRSWLGGIPYVIDGVYGSDVNVYFSGAWALMGTGLMRYAFLNSTDTELGTVKMSWSDPTTPVLEAIRELTFRTALTFSNKTFTQPVEATGKRLATKYKLQPAYLGGALAIIAVNALLVAWLYDHYWILGRQVSMSPLEIATAFQAPITAGADTNAEADVLARQLGARHIQYGTIETHGTTQKLAIASSDGTSWPTRHR